MPFVISRNFIMPPMSGIGPRSLGQQLSGCVATKSTGVWFRVRTGHIGLGGQLRMFQRLVASASFAYVSSLSYVSAISSLRSGS